jgi:hypothetical protein
MSNDYTFCISKVCPSKRQCFRSHIPEGEMVSISDFYIKNEICTNFIQYGIENVSVIDFTEKE